MSDFTVNTIFDAVDRISKVFGKQGLAAKLFGDKADRAFRKASKSGSRFGSILKGVLGANIISKGFGTLVRGVRNVINEFISFDDAVVSASAKFKGMNILTEQGRKSLEGLKRSARDVGAATQFTSAQAAEGLDFLALAGFNAEQAMATLPGVVDLATVANIDLARSTDIASDALGAFNLMTDDSVQLQKNFTRLSDVMATTMSRTNTNIEDMFESIKKGAPAFTVAGQSLESFNTLIGIMANAGLKGSESGTQLRNMMLRLADPTKEAFKVLDSLNIKIQDSSGDFRDIIDILEDFEKGLKGMGTAQRTAALSTVFGARSVTGINILLQAGTSNLRIFRKELLNNANASQIMADIMRSSLGNQLKALQSAAIELGFKFIEAFETKGKKGITNLTEAIRNFDAAPVISGLETVVKILGMLFDILKPLKPFIPQIVQGLIILTAALVGVKIAMIGVNIAMLANPVGIIIVAIGALIGLLTLLVLNWDIVVLAFKFGTTKIKNFFLDIWDTIKLTFFSFIKPIINIMSKVGSFVGFNTSSLDAIIFGINQKQSDIIDQANERNKIFGGQVTAPNETEIQSRQNIDFNANINLGNFPEGTTIDSTTKGTPGININLAGANP